MDYNKKKQHIDRNVLTTILSEYLSIADKRVIDKKIERDANPEVATFQESD